MAVTPVNANVTISQINIAAQKATLDAQYTALIAGITSELASVKSLVVNGRTYTRAQLITQLQSFLNALQTTKSDRAALAASVASERALLKEIAPLRMGVKQFLQSRYGKGSVELQKFGFTQAKTPQRPVTTKSAGIAKNLATRAARHTMGKKAKLTIRGTPPTPTAPPAPPSAPPAPPAPPDPAAPAPAAPAAAAPVAAVPAAKPPTPVTPAASS